MQHSDDDEAGDLRGDRPRNEAAQEAHHDASTPGVKI